MPRFVPGALALAASAAALCAQVPVGSTVIGIIGNTAPSEGLFLADRSGACTGITGLLAAGNSGINVNAVALDPIDDRIWIASSSTNQVNWIRIAGTLVTQWSPHGTSPLTSNSAIVFDDNSNPLLCGGTGGAGGLFHVDRKNGGPATTLGFVSTGIHNALAKDTAGNVYVGMFNAGGAIHVFTKNPDGSFQAPVLFGTVATATISGLTFAPTDGINPDELWVSTFGIAGSMMYRVPVPVGGVGTLVVNAVPASNWIEHDRRVGDLLVLTNTGPDNLVSVDRTTGLDTLVCPIQSGNVGVPAASDTHDAPFAAVQVAPMILNGGLGPFDLEIGTTAPPGTLAIVGTSFPSLFIAGVALVGADGRLSVSFPNLTLTGPLAPGSLQFVAAYFDLQGNLTIGSPVAWPSL